MAGMMIMHTWTLLHDLHHLVNGAAGQTSRTRRRRVDNICKVRGVLDAHYRSARNLRSARKLVVLPLQSRSAALKIWP